MIYLVNNRHRLVETINQYCDEHKADVVAGTDNIYLKDISEYENIQLLKELAYGDHKVIIYNEFQCEVRRLPNCRKYSSILVKEWCIKWLPMITSIISVIIMLLALLLK